MTVRIPPRLERRLRLAEAIDRLAAEHIEGGCIEAEVAASLDGGAVRVRELADRREVREREATRTPGHTDPAGVRRPARRP